MVGPPRNYHKMRLPRTRRTALKGDMPRMAKISLCPQNWPRASFPVTRTAGEIVNAITAARWYWHSRTLYAPQEILRHRSEQLQTPTLSANVINLKTHHLACRRITLTRRSLLLPRWGSTTNSSSMRPDKYFAASGWPVLRINIPACATPFVSI